MLEPIMEGEYDINNVLNIIPLLDYIVMKCISVMHVTVSRFGFLLSKVYRLDLPTKGNTYCELSTRNHYQNTKKRKYSKIGTI